MTLAVSHELYPFEPRLAEISRDLHGEDNPSCQNGTPLSYVAGLKPPGGPYWRHNENAGAAESLKQSQATQYCFSLPLICLGLLYSLYVVLYAKTAKSSLIQNQMHFRCTSDIHIKVPAYLSILAIFRDEAEYLAEWIEYHLLVGVERFWLINNDSNDDGIAILRPYIASDIVRLRNITGRRQQVVAYNRIIRTLKNDTFWLAVIDIDEFLVPVESRCVPPILKTFENQPALDLNWLLYGWNGKEKKENGLVIERFRYHSNSSYHRNHFVKGIVRPRQVIFRHVHWGSYRSGRSANPCGFNKATHFFHRPICHQILRLNHYWSKSKEEWERKVIRGHGYNNGTYFMSFMTSVDDVVRNDTVMDWYIPRVKANLMTSNTYHPCHVAANPNYYHELRFAYRSRTVVDGFSWVISLR
jgi:hypothetical protein